MNFLSSLQRCPSPYYKLREIQAEQVTWKDTKHNDNNTTNNNNDTTSSSSSSSEQRSANTKSKKNTTNTTTSESESESEQKEDEEDDDETKLISGYLGFLLVVSDDPFSEKLESAVHAVSPAFPHINFVKVP